MKFIEKYNDLFEIFTPINSIEVSNQIRNDENFLKKFAFIINIQYGSLFSSILDERCLDIILFSYNDMCSDLSYGEFGLIHKNIFYVIDYSIEHPGLDALRGVIKIDYTIYRMECNFRFFQGSLPFQFLISTSLVYKYIKINLTPQEERFRDLPF
jgi:hypothetical protein